ncbi:MAG: FAD-binding protein [Acidimicrobiia bacterium]|nr:FAD-binding protein [Acidimicrobiia bacterium]
MDESEFDVVIVGFGGAGSAAALEAAGAGAQVLVVDRFAGGGATRLCAGIVYLGGGTKQQRLAGFADTPGGMEAYLRTETEDAVDPDLVRAFCRQSLENYEWLQAKGVGFPEDFYEPKTTVPGDRYGLYYSGNERQRAAVTPPVPRGHRVAGDGLSGKYLYESLSAAVLAAGVTVWRHSEAVRLVTDEAGAVTGLELRVLDGKWLQRRHSALAQLHQRLVQGNLPGAAAAQRALVNFEERHGRKVTVRASSVVLASGGFGFSSELMARHGGPYRDATPLGTPADDGAAIRLGTAVGAATGNLDRFAASRFICPPDAFVCGVLVNAAGERICDETLYGASLSVHIAEKGGGDAFLVIDQPLWERARREMQEDERLRDFPMRIVLAGGQNHVVFRKGTAWVNRHVNRKKASTLADLGRRRGIDPDGLAATVAVYNEDAQAGRPDGQGKDPKYVSALTTPPYYAIDASLGALLFPAPFLSLGGLAVEGIAGAVCRRDGGTIPGLFAAGRAAAGVSSRSYVSGLSVADAIFSGRNAGRAAAEVALSHRPA